MRSFWTHPIRTVRSASLIVLWPQHDLQSLAMMARKTGYTAADFRELFQLCSGPRSSLWLDLTPGSPMPVRIDGFKHVRRAEDDNKENVPAAANSARP